MRKSAFAPAIILLAAIIFLSPGVNAQTGGYCQFTQINKPLESADPAYTRSYESLDLLATPGGSIWYGYVSCQVPACGDDNDIDVSYSNNGGASWSEWALSKSISGTTYLTRYSFGLLNDTGESAFVATLMEAGGVFRAGVFRIDPSQPPVSQVTTTGDLIRGSDWATGAYDLARISSGPYAGVYVSTQPWGDVFKLAGDGTTWNPTTALPGRSSNYQATRIIATSDNMLYVGVKITPGSAKVFRSADGGASWVDMSLPSVGFEIGGMVEHKGKVYAAVVGVGSNNNLYSMATNGAPGSWALAPAITGMLESDYITALDSRGGALYAAAYPHANVFATTDEGATWSLADVFPGAGTSFISPGAIGTITTGPAGELYAGITIRGTPSAPFPASVDRGIVYKSSCDPYNLPVIVAVCPWTKTGAFSDATSYQFIGASTQASDGSIFIGGQTYTGTTYNARVDKTGPGGTVWTVQSTGLPSASDTRVSALLGASNGNIYAAASTSVYRIDNSADTTWSQETLAANTKGVNDLTEGGGYVFAVTAAGGGTNGDIYRSLAGSGSWTGPLTDPPSVPATTNFGVIKMISISGTDYLFLGKGSVASPGDGDVYRSTVSSCTSGTCSWTRMSDLLIPGGIKGWITDIIESSGYIYVLVSKEPPGSSNDDQIYVFSSTAASCASPGTCSWTQATLLPGIGQGTSVHGYQLLKGPSGEVYVAAGLQGGIFGSNDQGNTWKFIGGGMSEASPLTLTVLQGDATTGNTYAIPGGIYGGRAAYKTTAACSTNLLDTTPPESTLNCLPSPSADSTPTFTGTAADTGTPANNVVDVEYRIMQGTTIYQDWTNVDAFASSPSVAYSFTAPSIGVLLPGTYTFLARARDAAGNWETSNGPGGYPSCALEIVASLPETVLNPFVPDPTNDNTPTYTGTASATTGTISNVEVRIDGGIWSSAGVTATDGNGFNSANEDFTFTTPILADGSHTVEARAVDSFALPDPTPALDTLFVDTVAPGPYTWNQPPAGSIYKNGDTINIDVSVTDPAPSSGIADGASCNVRIDGAVAGFAGSASYSAGKCAGSIIPIGGLPDGVHQLTVQVADNAGNSAVSSERAINISNVGVAVVFSIDGSTPPGPAYTTSIAGSVNLYYTITDGAGAGIAGCKFSNTQAGLAGAVLEACSAGANPPKPWALDTPGIEGKKTVWIEVRDNLANTVQGSDDIILDYTPPTLASYAPSGCSYVQAGAPQTCWTKSLDITTHRVTVNDVSSTSPGETNVSVTRMSNLSFVREGSTPGNTACGMGAPPWPVSCASGDEVRSRGSSLLAIGKPLLTDIITNDDYLDIFNISCITADSLCNTTTYNRNMDLSWLVNTSPTATPQEGSYTIWAAFRDGGGNIDPGPGGTNWRQLPGWLFKIDNTGPAIGISVVPASATTTWTNQAVTITATCADSGSGCNLSELKVTTPQYLPSSPACDLIDISQFTLGSITQVVNSEADYYVCATGTDNVGNRAYSATVHVFQETLPPVISVSVAPSVALIKGNYTNSTILNVSWTSADALPTVPGSASGIMDFSQLQFAESIPTGSPSWTDWTASGTPIAPTTGTWRLFGSNLPDTFDPVKDMRTYSFQVKARDNAGNTGPFGFANVTVDLTDPNCTINPLPAFTKPTIPAPGIQVFSISYTTTDFDSSGLDASGVKQLNISSTTTPGCTQISNVSNNALPGDEIPGFLTGADFDLMGSYDGCTYTLYCQPLDNVGHLGPRSGGVSTTIDASPPFNVIAQTESGEWTNQLSFDVNWSAQDSASGVQCFDVDYMVTEGQDKQLVKNWDNWTIGGVNCTASLGAVFGPASPVTVLNNRTYYFNVTAMDIVNHAGSIGAIVNTTVDLVKPNLTLNVTDQAGRPITSKVVSSQVVSSININSTSFDEISGVERNLVNTWVTQNNVITFDSFDCGPSLPWLDGVSQCVKNVAFASETNVKYQVESTDRAGNVNQTKAFYIVTHPLANFVSENIHLTAGDKRIIEMQVRNLQEVADTVTVRFSDYPYAAFFESEVKEQGGSTSDGNRTMSILLNPDEEKLFHFEVISTLPSFCPSSGGGLPTCMLNLTATSAADPGGTVDSDTLRITIGFTAAFPGLNEWAIALLVLLAAMFYYIGILPGRKDTGKKE